MHVLSFSELFPGRNVWLENYGEAFKTFSLLPMAVEHAQDGLLLLAGESGPTPLCERTYNRDMTWRCWDTCPDADTLTETPWLDDALLLRTPCTFPA